MGMEEDLSLSPSPTFFRQYGPALILGGVSLFFIITSLILLFKTTQSSEPIIFSSQNATQSSILRNMTADIEGAVGRPGVYTFPEGSRVEDVLEKAGGLTAEADSEWVAKTINRASLVSDGAKFYIPKKGAIQSTAVVTGTGDATAQDGTLPVISINTASEKELDTLPGVGPVTAQKMIGSRPYQRLEELLEKKVLTISVYEKIKGQITL